MTDVYGTLLRPPAQRAFLLAALLGRFPMAILGLATITTMTAATGSYAIAGLISAAMVLSQSICAPSLGRLADRVGQSRMLVPVSLTHALALIGVAAAATMQAPLAATLVLAVVAGASFPPLGPLVRQRWRHALGRRDQVLAAYSLESALDEVSYVLGPLVVVLLNLVAVPAWGLVASAVTSLTGALLFVRCRSSEPPVLSGSPVRLRASQPPLRQLLLIAVAVGMFVGATEVSLVAAADAHGSPWIAGALISAFSVGSVLAGLAFGAHPPQRPGQQQLVYAGGGLIVAATAMLAVPSIWFYLPAVLLAGCLFAPSLIIAYDLLAEHVDDDSLTEGFAWMQAALGLGLGAGTAGAGVVVGMHDARLGFAVLLIAALVATISATGLARCRSTATLPV